MSVLWQSGDPTSNGPADGVCDRCPPAGGWCTCVEPHPPMPLWCVLLLVLTFVAVLLALLASG